MCCRLVFRNRRLTSQSSPGSARCNNDDCLCCRLAFRNRRLTSQPSPGSVHCSNGASLCCRSVFRNRRWRIRPWSEAVRCSTYKMSGCRSGHRIALLWTGLSVSEQWFVASCSCGQDYQCQNNGLSHRAPVDKTIKCYICGASHRAPVDRMVTKRSEKRQGNMGPQSYSIY